MTRESDRIDQHFWVDRVTIAGWLVGWYIKLAAMIPYLFVTVPAYPVKHPLFPQLFSMPVIAQAAYMIPVIIILGIVTQRIFWVRMAAVVMVVCSGVLALHIVTCHDGAFVTSFWVALWVLWFSWNMHRTEDPFRYHACFMAQGIVSMIFLAMTIGNASPEYWRGDVIYAIYVAQERSWPYPFIRQLFVTEELRMVAGWLAKAMVIMEGVIASAVIWSAQAVCITITLLMGVLIVLTAGDMFSAFLPVMGMLGGCLVLVLDEEKEMSSARITYA